MQYIKNKISSVLVSTVFLSSINQVLCQDSLNQLLKKDEKSPPTAQQPFIPSPPQPPAANPAEGSDVKEKKRRKFLFFKPNEQKEKHKKELQNLKARQKQEIEEFHKKIEDEKKQEIEEQKKAEAFNKKVTDKQAEIMIIADKIVEKRNYEIKEIKKSDNTVEIISDEEDPLYIKKAQVLKSKTDFMEIKDVELKYRLELNNQTPKIINFVLIVWERKIAFNDTQTLAKEMKVAKPITPYEKRIVEYNELDSRRNGETYKVKISKVVFEDGTQWNSPT